MSSDAPFADILGWARAAVEQVALTDRVTGDRPDASQDARRDRALATVLLEVIVAQASTRSMGPSAVARSTIAAMLGTPGERPEVDVPPFVAQAHVGVLGTIHESIHGLVLDDEGRLAGADGSRKAVGAYYTPPAAVELLLEHTLAPVLAARPSPEAIGAVRVLDPACGGGNFLVAALARIATALEAAGTDPLDARRTAAGCLVGVDVDPVAVVLARVGIWLTVGDRALLPTRFTEQVVLGDALAGWRHDAPVDVHEGAFEAAPDDDRRTAGAWRRDWKARLANDPDLVARAVATDARTAFDALSMLWQVPKVPGAASPVDVLVALAAGDELPREPRVALDRLLRQHRPLHWPLDVPAARAGFDVVVGNPPYVKSRAHGRTNPGLRRKLTRTRPECRGGQWNLFVPFVALGADLLRAGGRSALLVPNAVVAADFAAPLHRHLADRVIEVLDFTKADLFEEASVHVAALVTSAPGTSAPGTADDTVTFVVHDQDLAVATTQRVDRELLRRLPPGYWCLPLLAPDLDVPVERLLELLDQPTTIADIGTSRDGATTQEAYALKELVHDLREDEPLDQVFRFANTGTIDPDEFQWGTRPAVYLGDRYLHPVVDRSRLADEFPKRAVEAARPKVLLAGLSARLEAVADPTGEWLCGKSAVQILVEDGKAAERLARWCNRPELSALYRALFGLAGFGGKGMNVAPALVGRLPAPPDDWEPPAS